MKKRSLSLLELYEEEDILLVLDFIDELIRLNIANNQEYNLHIEWMIHGKIRNNIKTFTSIYEYLLKEDYTL